MLDHPDNGVGVQYRRQVEIALGEDPLDAFLELVVKCRRKEEEFLVFFVSPKTLPPEGRVWVNPRPIVGFGFTNLQF